MKIKFFYSGNITYYSEQEAMERLGYTPKNIKKIPMPAGTVIVNCMYPDITPDVMVTFDLDGFIIALDGCNGLISEGPLIAVEEDRCFIFGDETIEKSIDDEAIPAETMKLNPTYITLSA